MRTFRELIRDVGVAAFEAMRGKPVDPTTGTEMTYAEAVARAPKVARKGVADTTVSSLQRLRPGIAEFLWLRESTINAGCNLYNALVIDSGYTIYSDDPATQMAIDRWFAQQDEYGAGHRHFDDVCLSWNSLHLAVHGNSWIEKIQGKAPGLEKKIYDVAILDPNTMDFMREDGGAMSGMNVAFDEYGRPEGYVQVAMGSNYEEIEFTRDQVQHNSTFQLHPGTFGTGFPERMVDLATLQLNVTRSKAELSFNLANPKPIVTYGTPIRRPSTEMKDIAMTIGDDIIDEKVGRVAIPDYLKLDRWNVSDQAKIDDTFIKLLIEMQAGILCIPSAILLQSADGFSRSGFELMLDHFQFTFRSFQRNLGLDRLMTDILRFNGEPHKDIKVRYGSLSDRVFKEESLRFLRMAKAGMLNVNDPVVSKKAMEIAGVTRDGVPTVTQDPDIGSVQPAPVNKRIEDVLKEVPR